jgi:two-component sensor histidine kinase
MSSQGSDKWNPSETFSLGHSLLLRLIVASPKTLQRRVLFAVVAVALSTLVRESYNWATGEALLFASYYPAILIVTMACGAAVAILAIVLSFTIVWFAFMEPKFSFGFPNGTQSLSILFFALMAALIVFVGESYRHLVHELQERDTRLHLLFHELQHRSRNLLAVAQAIISQSLHNNPEAAAKIAARLGALARADNLIGQSADHTTDLKQILSAELDAYGIQRCSLEGPPTRLTPEFSRVVALIMHELATNAAKHGALSDNEGRIAIVWSRGENTMRLSWRESGGPPVSQPTEQGFGMQFIRSIAGAYQGAIESLFKPDGVVHTISLEVPRPE